MITRSTPYQSRQGHKRWVECADARHATTDSPTGPGDVVTTLCRETATVVLAEPGRYAPECPGCDRRWRAAEGIPQREQHVDASRSGTGHVS